MSMAIKNGGTFSIPCSDFFLTAKLTTIFCLYGRADIVSLLLLKSLDREVYVMPSPWHRWSKTIDAEERKTNLFVISNESADMFSLRLQYLIDQTISAFEYERAWTTTRETRIIPLMVKASSTCIHLNRSIFFRWSFPTNAVRRTARWNQFGSRFVGVYSLRLTFFLLFHRQSTRARSGPHTTNL